MKAMRLLCLTAVLVSAFTLPASAGDIECGVTAPPPPPPTVAVSGEATEETGDITADLLAALLSGLLTVL